MWQPPTAVVVQGRELSGLEAWVYVFAKAWEELELDKEDLYLPGFNVFGPAVAARHGNEDPAAVAQRLYPEAGEYVYELYPGVRYDSDPINIPESDVPF